MPQPQEATDLRRVDERGLLAALTAGQPLALAEAYHRTVPASHAVARRLLGTGGGVEDLLLAVYTRLWVEPPAEGPLEGWARRTTWTLGVERLRESQTAPASPSTAGLLPDLPAPDVRFLDAAERAIAELADDERRALLLAHDKGVATESQEPGAGLSLTRALLALAGPETAASDRQAMADDPCDDVSTMGDWCLGILDQADQDTVTDLIEQRSGCAATSRAVRRGRRRIEGLPATPDMGQRILVSVLTAGAAPATPATAGAVAADPASEADGEEMAPADAAGTTADLSDAAAAGAADMPSGEDVVVTEADDPHASASPDEAVSPFAPPAADAVEESDVAAFAPLPDADDPFGELDDAATEPAEGVVAGPAVGDTADLPQSEQEDVSPGGSWIPGPGDTTAELRLSDILADDDDDDDPFADLEQPDEPLDDPAVTGRDPYSALRGLGEDAPLQPQGPISPAFAGGGQPPQHVVLPDEEELVGGYVEGQEAHDAGGARPSRMAAALAWILPIVGGSALGVIVAILVFGLPS